MTEEHHVDDPGAIRSWLRLQVSRHVRRPLTSIENDVPLSNYGMDSVSAISLAFDIEERYHIELDTEMLWEYRTVDLLAELVRTLTSQTAES